MSTASPAQTNLQLFAQLRQQAYNAADIARVRDSYILATEIFAGQYRGSGKTFLAHLIGTASVLVAEHAPISLVCAGLLHSAYSSGEFGKLLRRNVEPARRQVRTAAGDDAEIIVDAYTHFRWNTPALQQFLDTHEGVGDAWRVPHSDPAVHIRSSVIAIRLANEIDEHADEGNLHRADYAAQTENTAVSIGLWLTAARALQLVRIENDLLQIIQADAAGASAPILSARTHEAYTIAPRSHVKRLAFRVRQKIDNLKNGFHRR